jgi:hypothetical protein
MGLAVASSILAKESGLLLAAPLAVFALVSAVNWRGLTAAARRRRVTLMAACALPLGGGVVLAVVYGSRKGSYAHDRVMGHPLRLSDFDVAIFRSDATLALLILAGLVAGLALLVATRRASVVLVLAQLAAVAGFYTYYRAFNPYYYYPAVAMAAVLTGASLFPARQRRMVWRAAAAAVATVFLVYGGVRGMSGAWALAGWSRLYHELVMAVVQGRPPRALFYESGGSEVYQEAALVWEHVYGLPIVTGVLEPTDEWKAPPPGVSVRDLRRGDWILEQFGSPDNASMPLRDMNVARSTEAGLMGPSGNSLLPIRQLHRYETRFWCPRWPFSLFPLSPGFLEWRVYEVTDRPRVAFEGLEGGRWMKREATLWVRPGGLRQVTLRFFPFVHAPAGQSFANELTVRRGEEILGRCPATVPGTAECRVNLLALEESRDGEWVPLRLVAARTFSPRRLGLSPDPRELSFNFGPSWEAGLAGVLAEHGPRPPARSNSRIDVELRAVATGARSWAPSRGGTGLDHRALRGEGGLAVAGDRLAGILRTGPS